MVVGEALRRGVGGSCFPERELLAQTEDEEIQTLEMLSCRQSRQEASQILTWRPIKWDFFLSRRVRREARLQLLRQDEGIRPAGFER